MGLFKKVKKVSSTPRNRRAQLHVEALETRVVPYSVSGNAWPHPALVTLSFVPDGTDLGGVSSNLYSTFNSHPGWTTSTWQSVILKAAQSWAQQTNINFSLISDSGASVGSGNYQQGDPGFGDIRIGGFNFGSSDLAGAYMPPPVNNFSVAGDIDFNTGQSFNINSTYDLFTVAAHEVGHALGLMHSTTPSAEMYTYYNGIKKNLAADDIAGIRNIYSANAARSADAYDAAASNGSFATASNISSAIDPTALTGVVSGDITTTSDADYYSLTVPSGTGGTLKVTLQSAGLSLLAPNLTIYNSSQQVVGSVSGAGQYGTTLTLSVSGVSAGQQFFIKVVGADTTAFGTGAYALALNVGNNADAVVPLPNTQTANGTPLHSGGGTADKPGTDDEAPPLPARNQTAIVQIAIQNQSITVAGQVAVHNTVVVQNFAISSMPLEVRAVSRTDAPVRVQSGSAEVEMPVILDETSDSPASDSEAKELRQAPASAPAERGEAKVDFGAWRSAASSYFESDVAADSKLALTEPAPLLSDMPATASSSAFAACVAIVLAGYWAPRSNEDAAKRLLRAN